MVGRGQYDHMSPRARAIMERLNGIPSPHVRKEKLFTLTEQDRNSVVETAARKLFQASIKRRAGTYSEFGFRDVD